MQPKTATSRTARRQVNVKLLLLSLAFIIVSVPLIMFVHSLQMQRVSKDLLKRIDDSVAQESWKDATKFIERYLLLNPTDGQKKVVLAEVYDKSAVTFGEIQRSIALHSVALGVCEVDKSLAEKATGLRGTLTDRLMQVGRFEDAMDTIAKMAGPELDVLLEKKLALCRFRLALDKRTHRLPVVSEASLPKWLSKLEAMHWLDLLFKALQDNPADKELTVAVAQVCLEPSDLTTGSTLEGESVESLRDRAMVLADQLLSKDRNSLDAWMTHYEIVSKIDDEIAESDIQKALSLEPENMIAVRQAGMHYLRRYSSNIGRMDVSKRKEWLALAEQYFTQVKESKKSGDVALYSSLGTVLASQDRSDDAIAIWKEGIRVAPPPTAILHLQMIAEMLQRKKYTEAKESLAAMDLSIQKELPSVSRNFQNLIVRSAKQQWASYYMSVGEFLSATTIMEEVVSGNRDLDAPNQAEAWAFLGGAYAQLGQHDRSANAFEQASVLVPTNSLYKRNAAREWFSAQRFGESLRQTQLIESKLGVDWLLIAESILELQKRQKQDADLWRVFDNAVGLVEQRISEEPELVQRPWSIDLLKIDSAVLRSELADRSERIEQSVAQLEKLCQQFPESMDLLRVGFSKVGSWGNVEGAKRLAKRSMEQSGENNDAAIVYANFLASTGESENAKKLLEKRLVENPNSVELLQAKGELDSNITQPSGNVETASSNGLARFQMLKNLCASALDTPIYGNTRATDPPETREKEKAAWNAKIESLEKELRISEGESGTEWRLVRATRLLAVMAEDKAPNLTEVAEIAGFLDRQRPHWAPGKVLLAEIAERQGNAQQAIREYVKALQLGSQSIRVYERLAALYLRQGLLTDASALMDRLGERASSSRSLSSMALQMKDRSNSELVELAESGTTARPNDPMAWIWYSQVLESASRNLPAIERQKKLQLVEDAIQKAKSVSAKEDARAISAEFTLAKTLNQREREEKIAQELELNDSVAPLVKWQTAGEMHQSIGNIEKSLAAYGKAISAGANKPELSNRMASMMTSIGKLDDAITLMTSTLREHPNDIQCRRSLSILLATRGSDKDWEEIGRMLAGAEQSTRPDDKRLRAELLLERGKPDDLLQAQYILEGLVEDTANRTDSDQFRLASVYIRNAKIQALRGETKFQSKTLLDAAGRQLKQLTTGNKVPPDYVYAYADFLLENNRVSEAEEQSKRLSFMVPDNFSAIFLQARIQQEKGNANEAVSTVRGWLEAKRRTFAEFSPVQKAMVLGQAGQALSFLRADTEAQSLLREAYELDSRVGNQYVRSLAKSDDSVARNEAIQALIKRVNDSSATDSALLLASLLSSGQFDSGLVEEAESALKKLQTDSGQEEDLQLAMAEYWISKDKNEEAIEAYRKVIALRPNDVVALNNLATLLSEKSGYEREALGYIDRALSIAGRQPLILDTKGVILLNAKKYDDAIQIFEIASAASNDPRLAFHLYVALDKAGRGPESLRVLKAINLEQLSKTVLVPSDRNELSKVYQPVSN